MQKKLKLYLLLILVVMGGLFSLLYVRANDGLSCYFTETPEQGPSKPSIYDLFNTPVRISSEAAGDKKLACGVATFAGAITKAAPRDAKGELTQQQVLDIFKNTGADKKFDDYLATSIAIANNDPVYAYTFTVKRINKYADPPVIVLPPPQIKYDGSVKIITYRPYNFGVEDIADAILKTNGGSAGGIVLGGVWYKFTNNQWKDEAAHMFQPVALSRAMNGNGRYPFKIYDPYFKTDLEREIALDNDKRSYVDIWYVNGSPLWFHLEELLIIEKTLRAPPIIIDPVVPKPPKSTGPITGGSTSQPAPIAPVKGPITPTCGNKIVEQGEECDDGNRENRDDCDNACRLTKCGDSITQAFSSRKEECDPPNSVCFKCVGGNCYGAICSNACKCDAVIPATPD